MKPIRISISGPRSVGKTSVSKIISKKLNLDFYSSDEMMEKKTKSIGGLDKAIKSGKLGRELLESAPELAEEILKSEEFILDLSGGAISSEKYLDIAENILSLVKENSFLIGLLPFKNNKESFEFLFLREKERVHFKEMELGGLRKKVEKDYIKVKKKLLEVADNIFYLEGRSSEEASEEIINYIKLNLRD